METIYPSVLSSKNCLEYTNAAKTFLSEKDSMNENILFKDFIEKFLEKILYGQSLL